jgi:hypothetical protein
MHGKIRFVFALAPDSNLRRVITGIGSSSRCSNSGGMLLIGKVSWEVRLAFGIGRAIDIVVVDQAIE